MIRQKRLWAYTIGLYLSILSICLFIYPVVSSLTVYSLEQKQSLLQSLENPLEIVAVQQARIVDPNYSWISFPETLSPEIQNAIKESVIASQSSSDEDLSTDSNLSWIVSYNGKTYKHNWDESTANTQGVLDLTFYAINGRVYVKEGIVGGYTPSFSLFNVQSRSLVNPQLIEESSTMTGNEFSYSIVLPDGFSIRYCIPSRLNANGGKIARLAYDMDKGNVLLCLAMGAVLLGLYVLFWKASIEKQGFILSHFIRLKALWAWLILIIGLVLSSMITLAVSEFTATGTFKEYLYSLGVGTASQFILPILCIASWFVSYFLITLLFLYVKYILCFGILRYAKEDTLTAHLFARSLDSTEAMIRLPLSEWTWTRLFPMVFITAGLIVFTTVLVWLFFDSWILGILVLVLDLVLLMLLLRHLYEIIYKDFMLTLSAADELVEGNFAEIKDKKAGLFQPLYNSLIHISDEFQSALKDGLANQNMKTQLISNVSHDLKTPVTGIKSYAELIGMAQSLDQVQEYSRRLNGYADRLSTLIEDLFDVAKATSGDIRLEPILLDLGELTMQVAGEWEDTLEARDIKLVMDFPDSVMTMLDPDKTMRVIDNLLSNVNKYAMEGTRVFLSLQELPNEYVLVIKNISKTPLDFDANEITERFVRGDRSRHEPGSGLGLAIVKSFMEVQQGSFSIDIDGDVFKAILNFPKTAPVEPPLIPETVKSAESPAEAPGKPSAAEPAEEPSAEDSSMMSSHAAIKANALSVLQPSLIREPESKPAAESTPGKKEDGRIDTEHLDLSVHLVDPFKPLSSNHVHLSSPTDDLPILKKEEPSKKQEESFPSADGSGSEETRSDPNEMKPN